MPGARPSTPPDLHAGGARGVTSTGSDPIIDEVRSIRDEIAKAHGYDLKAIIAMLQAEQTRHGGLLVSRQARRLGPAR